MAGRCPCRPRTSRAQDSHLKGLFDEFAAAFQFPYYFGENWAAFRDCISDLAWLPFTPGVVVLVYGADEVLADAHPAELTTLVQTLATAAAEFAETVSEGEWWDRDPVPFHVVLQGVGEGDFERWRAAGARLERLPTWSSEDNEGP